MKKFSYVERGNVLAGLKDKRYDVIVIGGGITGSGIALDCTTRGLKTLLVEMQDFAAGTSSRSTKLVHGGLRYLKQFEVKMVADVGKERAIVYENAPHVTHPEWMLLPFYKKGAYGKHSTSLGLKVYDFLAGVKRGERRKILSRKEVIKREPLLKEEGLLGGGEYVEYRTDDARLTIEVAKKASEQGANLLNYAKVEGFHYHSDGQVTGVSLKDELSGQQYRANGKMIINAAGPWVEKVMEMDENVIGKSLLHTKGVHIVINREKLPIKQPIYFEAPDGRMIFAIPRNRKTYIGTTDTVFEEDLKHPKITTEDKQYLLRCIQSRFPKACFGTGDIESAWAGVRPLIREEGKDPSEISRKDEIWTSKTGLITIAGGKLTGYRKMAETVTDLLSVKLKKDGIKCGKSVTKKLRLSGGDFFSPNDYPRFIEKKAREFSTLGMSADDGANIAAVYGTNVETILLLKNELHKQPELPLAIKLTLHYAIHYEMAMTPVDFLMRRTGAVFFDIHWVQRWKQPVIDYMEQVFEWAPETKEKIIEDLETCIADSISSK